MTARGDELREAVRVNRTALVSAAIASGLINVLMLTGPLFMLPVYDRVLPSRSIPSLVGLALFALTLYAFQGVLEATRARLLLRIGLALDGRLSPRVFDLVMRNAAQSGTAADNLQPLRDHDTIRAFFASFGLTALFDLPWVPLYVAICFLFHPWLGCAVLAGALALCAITLLTEGVTRAPTLELTALAARRQQLAEAARRNAGIVSALGMRGRLAERWS